jgi:hypothetical protein
VTRLAVSSLALCCSFAAGSAAAQICKYVDEEGRVTYANAPVKGAKKLDCLEPPPPPPAPPPGAAAKPSAVGPAGAPAAKSPAGFPSVSPDEQRKRDDARRKILTDELAQEEKNLAEARKALEEGKEVRQGNERNYQRYLDRVKSLEDTVVTHERNVTAIKLELSKLK